LKQQHQHAFISTILTRFKHKELLTPIQYCPPEGQFSVGVNKSSRLTSPSSSLGMVCSEALCAFYGVMRWLSFSALSGQQRPDQTDTG
jgi:hypothetical protein